MIKSEYKHECDISSCRCHFLSFLGYLGDCAMSECRFCKWLFAIQSLFSRSLSYHTKRVPPSLYFSSIQSDYFLNPPGRLVFAFTNWTLNIGEVGYSPTTVAISGAIFVLVLFSLLSSFATRIVAALLPEYMDQVAQLQSLCNTVLIYVKVVCILICELGCWPFMCGMMVDRAAMAVFNTPTALRIHQAHESLEWFLILHWGIGVTVLTFMSWSLVMARRTLRPEVMWFLRDPDDPAFDPLREIIIVTVPRHVLRFFVSTLLYGPFVFATIVLPLLVAQQANMLPLAPPQEKVWLLSLLDDGITHISPTFSLSQALLESLASLAAAWLFSSLWKWNNQPFIWLIRSWSQSFGGWLGLTEWLLPDDFSREGQNSEKQQRPVSDETDPPSTSSQPRVPLLVPRLIVFVTVTFIALAAVPILVFNTALALSIAFISPHSQAQCPYVPVHLALHHLSSGTCSNSSLHDSFTADPRSFVVPCDRSLQVACVCVILCSAAAAGSTVVAMTITVSVIISRSCAVASFVPWVAAAICSSSWRSLQWSGRFDVLKRGIGAVVRWISCFLSYCVVAPYFVCFLVSAIGMLWPLNPAVRRCNVDTHALSQNLS